MPVHVCPRCQHTNPQEAAFCYHDGALLQAGGGNGKAAGQFVRDFVFPSGRRCKTFDEFSQGCQEEWSSARDLLREGTFKKFFGNLGRADLVKASQEAMGHADSDMGLTSFLGVLPVSRALEPKLDIHPRRLDLGKLTVGDVRRVQFTLANGGQGQLQGTLKVAVGADWLTLGNQASSFAISIPAKREQKVSLEINTQMLVALQNYGGMLTVVTNGGVSEIPVRLDLVSRSFSRPGFPDVKTPREMAEQMRAQSKLAVELLESGEVFRWFASNNWNYPVQGQPIKGMAGVQQFFEAMGLSKPPALTLSQAEFRLQCNSADPIRFQVVLGTQSRKWVYAVVESDRSWLRVLTPQVGGPQKAAISFQVDPGSILNVPLSEAKVKILANAGQKLPFRVVVESIHPSAVAAAARGITTGQPETRRGDRETGRRGDERRPAPSPFLPFPSSGRRSSPLSAILAMALVFLLVRLLLIPVADFWARGAAVRAAAENVNQHIAPDSPLLKLGGWLRLPWSQVLRGSGTMPAGLFDPSNATEMDVGEFRHYFVKFFIRDVVLVVWWLGPILGVMLVRRRGSWQDLHWGVLAGAVGGVVAGATLACLFLLIESITHAVWDLILAGRGDPVLLFVWIVFSLLTWIVTGAVIGLVLGTVGAGGGPSWIRCRGNWRRCAECVGCGGLPITGVRHTADRVRHLEDISHGSTRKKHGKMTRGSLDSHFSVFLPC